jgi:hypothetical protein
LNNGGALPKGGSPPPPIDPSAPPKPAAPSITDNEPGFSKAPDAKPGDPNATPKPPGGGKLRLPVTTLGPAPDKGKPDDTPPPPASPAQQTMQTAVKQQDDLLKEFAKVSDQLNQILTSLEASTFVKRFKAASKEQMKLATNIDQKTLDAFGIEDKPVEAAAPIAQQAKDQSEIVRVIQSDLDAYYERKQDARFKATLDEMKKTEIVQALAGDGDKVNVNLSGQALTGSQFWADTLDRWAEEMVAASHCKASSSCSGDSLPPEIVLKVMQSLRDEMKLRDSTREAENAKPAMDPQKYTEDAQGLGSTQADHRHSCAARRRGESPEGAGAAQERRRGDGREPQHARYAGYRAEGHRCGDGGDRAAAAIEALRLKGRRWGRSESRRRQRPGEHHGRGAGRLRTGRRCAERDRGPAGEPGHRCRGAGVPG